jgi:hypothetical protein
MILVFFASGEALSIADQKMSNGSENRKNHRKKKLQKSY